MFPPQKNKKITFFLCNFSVRSLQCFQNFFFFFAHKKLKNPPSKVAHNRPKPFLRQSSPGHSPQPRSSFPFYKKPNPNVSLLVSGRNLTRNKAARKRASNKTNDHSHPIKLCCFFIRGKHHECCYAPGVEDRISEFVNLDT